MRLVLVASAALGLAACNPAQPEAGKETSPVTEPAPLADTDTAKPSVAEEVTEESTDASSSEPSLIPAAYQGVWDYEGGTCSPESDMRMAVTETDITYYESYGKVTGTRPDGDDLIVDLAMEGEGQQWSESQRLAIVGTGTARRIHVTNGDEPKAPDAYPRKSCS